MVSPAMQSRTAVRARAVLLALALLAAAARSHGAARQDRAAAADGARPPAGRGVTCAVLHAPPEGGNDLAPLASLLETELAARPGVTLVERDAIEQVLREQQLGQALGAAQTAQRAALGRLLRADLLIILSPGAPPGPAVAAAATPGPPDAAAPTSHARLVACETRRGLRLLNAALPLTPDPQADARAAAARVDDALATLRRDVREIVAVPPFASLDLTHEFDHLKGAYAKLLEQALLRRDGVLVVELAEARSLAAEAALAGQDVRRALPLYVLGEYRTDRANPGRELTVTVGLSLRRGERELGTARRASQSPDAVPGFLAEALAGFAGHIDAAGDRGGQDAAPDPQAEARQLAQRAREFYVVADWAGAVPLYEASLLLGPGQPAHRLEAAVALSRLGLTPEEQRAMSGAMVSNPAAPAADRAREAALIERVIAAYRRRLDHVEAYLRDGRHDDHHALNAALFPCLWPAVRVGGQEPFDGPAVPRQYNARIAAAARDAYLRAVRSRLAEGAPSDRMMRTALGLIPWRVGRESREDALRLMLSVFREIGHLPDAPGCAEVLAQQSRGLMVTAWPPPDTPERRAFLELRRTVLLDPLRSWPDRRVGEAVDQFEKWNEMILAMRLADLKAADAAQQRTADAAAALASGAPVPGGATQRVTFRPIQPAPFGGSATRRGRHDFPTQGWIPAGDGVDVLWDAWNVWLMREPGRLELAMPRPNARGIIARVSYDGRYVWVAFRSAGADRPAGLAVFDPRPGGRAWDVIDAHGLPLGPQAQPSGSGVDWYSVAVAGVEPGRACAAGHFGRTWIATVTLDPDAGPKANVFFEAREQPVSMGLRHPQWANTSVAFAPTAMFTLRGPPAAEGGPPRRRVLVTGRGDRPLLVDPDVPAVVGVTAPIFTYYREDLITEHDGSVYMIADPMYERLGDGPPGPHLYRIGFPELEPVIEMLSVPQNHLRFYQGRPIVVGRGVWELELASRRAWPQASGVPWFHVNRFHVMADPTAHVWPARWSPGVRQLKGAHLSNHYGLVIQTQGTDNRTVTYAVEFVRPDRR
jgi:hypothetical protein